MKKPPLDLVSATLLELDEVDSTNALARTLAHEGQTDLPLVIVARNQSGGRGRGTNAWHSDAGSLTLSILIDPVAGSLKPEQWSRLALAASVAVVDTIQPYLVRWPAGIRWPNDVEINERKIAGLLPETIDTPLGPRLVLGIGLNVATHFHTAPLEVRALATTLELERAQNLPHPLLPSIQAQLLKHLSARLVSLAQEDPLLFERWQSLDTLRGRPVTIEQGKKLLSGIGAGIRDDGALMLQTDTELMPIFGGVVKREQLFPGFD